MPIKIRRGIINDLVTVSELNKKCLPLYYTTAEYLMLIMSPNNLILIAEDNGKIIGYSLGDIKDKNYHIMSIGVEESYRSKGVGSFMINYIKKRFSTISLYVHVENIKGIKFYEKNGFNICETLKDYYGGSLEGPSQDAYKMIV